jgi:hypothetical protein
MQPLIPLELIVEILPWVDIKTLVAISQVCKQWKDQTKKQDKVQLSTTNAKI